MEPDNVSVDPLLDKHLNELFSNTVFSIQNAFRDYVFGQISFSVL